MTLSTSVPLGFSLSSTVFSHGWSALPPFKIQRTHPGLAMVCDAGAPLRVTLAQRDGELEISVPTAATLPAAGRQSIIGTVRSCLRLNEDLAEFYAVARKFSRYRWIPRAGAGRLLRAPSVFEDAVKMICTTNCSWALTVIMTRNLCDKLCRHSTDDTILFPTPEAIADTSERYLRKEIRAG
jgi:hypothetical protein